MRIIKKRLAEPTCCLDINNHKTRKKHAINKYIYIHLGTTIKQNPTYQNKFKYKQSQVERIMTEIMARNPEIPLLRQMRLYQTVIQNNLNNKDLLGGIMAHGDNGKESKSFRRNSLRQRTMTSNSISTLKSNF